MPTEIVHSLRLRLSRPALAALALAALILVALALLQQSRPARAQGTISLEIAKTLVNPSNVVRVGQILTFTIRIENTGSITVTELPLFDQFEADILRFISADPSPDIETTGSLTWTNLVDSVGLIGPGRVVEVTTLFQAIRAEERTVNRAQIGAAQGAGGETGGGDEDSDEGPPAEGGRLPVTKVLLGPSTVRVGQLITFSMGILNDGLAEIAALPFEDTYDTRALLFVGASPLPDSIDVVSPSGTLRWNDLLVGRGPLAPGEAITVTSVFSTLAEFNGDVNSAVALNAADEFGNAVQSDRPAVVPIRIIAEEQPTPLAPTTTPVAPTPTDAPLPTPRPSGDDDDDEDEREAPTDEATPRPTGEATAQPTPSASAEASGTPLVPGETAVPTGAVATATGAATSAATAEATDVASGATATPTATAPIPGALPNTGGAGGSGWLWLGLLALLSLGAGALLRRR